MDSTDPAGSPPVHIPARFGRYTVIRPLARGGMAELFLARQDGVGGFEKLVVIKRVLEELAGDADITSMLGDEARLGAQLQHPNIVQVHELGEQDGKTFYVMEFLEGENLRSIWRRVTVRDGRFPMPIALAIVRAVAAALHYAHEARDLSGRRLDVIHRDVSPHNVIVTYQGAIKLVDFGIAKAHNRRAQKTRTGTLKGKLSYMSPEQARAQALDRRSDVFSLGIVLWELLTGVRLFDRQGDYDTLRAIIEEPILPVGVHLPGVPPELEAIVQRALSREVELRYQTARALDEALEAVVLDHGLQVSDLHVAEFMDRHYAERIDSWREAHRLGGSAIARHFSTRDLPALASGEEADSASGFDATLPHTPVQPPLGFAASGGPGPRSSRDLGAPGPDEPGPTSGTQPSTGSHARTVLAVAAILAVSAAAFAASSWLSRTLRAPAPGSTPTVVGPAPTAAPATPDLAAWAAPSDLAAAATAPPPEVRPPSEASPLPVTAPPPALAEPPPRRPGKKAKSRPSRPPRPHHPFDPDAALPAL